MSATKKWIAHFMSNAMHQRIDWNVKPSVTAKEIQTILASLQAWQLGETSDGSHLIRAATKYAHAINDPAYVESVKLFIKEEQKHGNNLGKYLDAIGKPRIKKDWGDTLFRKIRYFNTSMEVWTLAVITVESAAQIFYQCLKDATGCGLLKQVCTDILIDEAYHIEFQTERLEILFENKSLPSKFFANKLYTVFFFATTLVVWMAHKQLFKAGGVHFKKFMRKMRYKYFKTIYCVAFKRSMLFNMAN